MSRTADAIEISDIVLALRRGWRAVVSYTAIGIAGAIAVVLFAPKRYDGTATIILRTTEPLSVLSRLGGNVGGAIGADAASALTGGRSSLETEQQILESRSVAQDVIDSLALQVRVRSPQGVPSVAIVERVNLPRPFRRAKLRFARTSDGRIRLAGAGIDTVVSGGAAIPVLGGQIVFRAGASVPAEGRLDLLDREDGLERFGKRLSVGKAGGEVLRVTYRADDSLTAASVPNALVASYLVRRKTTDRGVNEHRVEFLTLQLDSTARELSSAERDLRRYQESSGVMSAEVMGRVQLERGAELRKQLTSVQVEEGAITQLVAQVDRGTISPRELAAYPSFLRSTGLSDLLSQLSTLEAERLKLLERRTDRDPEVQAIALSISTIQGQFLPMARTYATALTRQRQELESELDTLRTELGILPGAAESGNRLQRNVLRLSQIFAALQGQLVEARLAAIGEGGDVHQLDVAASPKKPAFPEPVATLTLGSVGGLLTGIVAALVLAVFGRWARDPAEIERTTGVATLRFDRRAPLIVANDTSRAVLVIPLYASADALGVSKQLVETALSRASSATLLDLANGEVPLTSLDVNATIERLSGEFGTVVVRLPSMDSETTLAALNSRRAVVFVVPTGRVEREHLTQAMQTLRRLDVPCAGIVVSAAVQDRGLPPGSHALVG